MAVKSSFKLACPSCEAMVTVKESMIGKKVECTKCKDKFLAEPPDGDVIDNEENEAPSKKDTKSSGKKKTGKAPDSKSSSNGKRPKLEVEDDADDHGDDDDEEPQVKGNRSKSDSNGKSSVKARKDSTDDADEEEVEEKPKKSAANNKNKLVVGLALAVVGVVILIVAAVFVMKGGGSQKNNPPPVVQKDPEKKKDDLPPPKDKDVDPPKGEPVLIELTEGEIAKLSNLLPNDTEHVTHYFYKDLFHKNSSLRASVFDAPGALDDKELKTKLGFSLLAIDDLICAEKYSFPPWKYTVIHFNELVNEKELVKALGLKPTQAAIEGQKYYLTTGANPWFDSLSRISLGVPNLVRNLAHRSESASYVRLHNAQTLIIGDERPVTDFLKAKGRFEPLNPRGGGKEITMRSDAAPDNATTTTFAPHGQKYSVTALVQGGVGEADIEAFKDRIRGTKWIGTEAEGTEFRLTFLSEKNFNTFLDTQLSTPSQQIVTWTLTDANPLAAKISIVMKVGASYELTFEPAKTPGSPSKISGTGKKGDKTWPVNLKQTSGDPYGYVKDKDKNPPDKKGGDALKFGGTAWDGDENIGTKLAFRFSDNGIISIDSELGKLTNTNGGWQTKPGNKVEISSPNMPGVIYKFQLDATGTKLTGFRHDGPKSAPAQVKLSVGKPIVLETEKKDPKKDPDTDPTYSRDDMYLTINKTLKAILDRMETRNAEKKEKILLSSATDMDANVIEVKELKDIVLRRPRAFWDASLLLTETKPRIRYLGTSILQRDVGGMKFQLRNEITCAVEQDAKEFRQSLAERGSFGVSSFFKTVFGLDVQTPDSNSKGPEGKWPEASLSQITAWTPKDSPSSVKFALDIVLPNLSAITQVQSMVSFFAAGLRFEIAAAATASHRHQLGSAALSLRDKGLTYKIPGERAPIEFKIEAGRFPPGAMVRDKATLQYYTDREPKNRISWMAGLLPHLNHQSLFDAIRFDRSWRDPENWVAGRTMVPQFLDPSYPDLTRAVSVGGIPVDYSATHYVGIAGVGMDAASYVRGDPGTKHLQGVLGYESSASLEEVKKGRGASNTILMIQVPHDGMTGVTPWMAGGGATLRGVPETNSIAPFVLTTDRSGKTIHYQNKKGTYALMTDGSVRFIDQSISDDAFKAMCTIGESKLADFEKARDQFSTVVPMPDKKKTKEPEKKPEEKKIEDKKPPEKKPEEKKPAEKKTASDDAKLLQGTWIATSLSVNGKMAPAENLKAFRMVFTGDKVKIRINPAREDEHAFKVDPAQSPKHLMYSVDGTKMSNSIYELAGNELRVCLQVADAPRPTGFTGDVGIMAVLKKQSP